jgi:radical SAM superfamily enzyme YgiQ (UPF0313 family)
MEYLTEAGLFFMEVGIQTGSARINEMYQRKWSSREIVKEAVSIINRYKDHVMPLYDVILDNPFATSDDEMETLRLILELPKPYVLQIFSLTLFPGTKLLEQAMELGIVDDERKLYQKDYRVFRRNYLNALYVLLCRGVPPKVVRFLSHRIFLLLFDRAYFERMFLALIAVRDWCRKCIGRIRVMVRWRHQLQAEKR